MPHVIVKLYPGRSEQQKIQITEKIVKNIVEIAECKDTAVSVAFEEIDSIDWAEKVYRPDIIDGRGTLYKKPGYDPFSVRQKKHEKTTLLMKQVREAAQVAEKTYESDDFNAMSWLDLELEDNPGSFDDFFDRAWDDLSAAEQEERLAAIRSVL